jgi:hypothetical protein
VSGLAITAPDYEGIVAQALRLLAFGNRSAFDLHFGVTSTVALQSRIAHNLCVSEFQFGGDSSMLFV